MKRLFPALTAALMASSMAAVPLYAQDAGSSKNAPGMTKQEMDQGSAKEQAPGKMQRSGEVEGAKDAAPGQVTKQESAGTDTGGTDDADGDASTSAGASDYAPGNVKKEDGEQSATDSAPGQMQKSGEADGASDVAPGQQMQDNASAPSDETTGSIDLSSEQQTEIRSVLVDTDVEPVDIDVDLSVGVAVPNTVTLHPLPPRIVEIVPAYQSYEYFVLADGRIVIVEPATLEVVYIIVA